MGCELVLSFIGCIVVTAALGLLLIFLGHVCHWAYKNRDAAYQASLRPHWADLRESVREETRHLKEFYIVPLEARVEYLEGRLRAHLEATKAKKPSKR